jgi:hypothetical protein
MKVMKGMGKNQRPINRRGNPTMYSGLNNTGVKSKCIS